MSSNDKEEWSFKWFLSQEFSGQWVVPMMIYIRVNHGSYLFVDHGWWNVNCVCLLALVTHLLQRPVLLKAGSHWGTWRLALALYISTHDESHQGVWLLETKWVVWTVCRFCLSHCCPLLSWLQAVRQLHLTSSQDNLSLLKMHWIRISIFFFSQTSMPATWCDMALILLFLLQIRRATGPRNTVGQQQLDGMSCQSNGGWPVTVGREAERKGKDRVFIIFSCWFSNQPFY